ncbi:MAG TPA: nickel pincer cofactor biosynthesis protein LarC [Chloroflexota bacterium]|nr:nickel pincer cofactor biosynthesis protein LarC [Chloroflexota bacterium]
MRLGYFDMVGGAAGDMIVAAMLDAGLQVDDLRDELAALPVSGYRISMRRVDKQHITATQFLVDVDGHDNHHHGGGPDHGRSLGEIRRLISSSRLDAPVIATALQIFETIGRAEAAVHGVAVDDVHFHEIGAIDSIVDVVSAAIGIHRLGLEEVYCSAFPLGSGFIETQHGPYPIPAPATLRILADAAAPIRDSPIDKEQVTPTGAGILATVAHFRRPAMQLQRVGYGAGQAELAVPNVIRLWVGESGDGYEELHVLETTIDDMNPELYPDLIQLALAEGALDAVLVPVTMKRGRPGTRIELLSGPADAARLTRFLLDQTSTLGVRSHVVRRLAAPRAPTVVQTRFGPVQAKVKSWDGHRTAVPEYASCRALSEERGVPVLDVYRAAVAACEELGDR